MQILICQTIRHPSGVTDQDLKVGELYEVVDPVDSTAGEYITVRRSGTVGPDITRPQSMFTPVQAMQGKTILHMSKEDLYHMIRGCNNLLNVLQLETIDPVNRVLAMDSVHAMMTALSRAIIGGK